MNLHDILVHKDDRLAIAEIHENAVDRLGDWFLDLDEEFQEDLIAAVTIYRNQAEAVEKAG